MFRTVDCTSRTGSRTTLERTANLPHGSHGWAKRIRTVALAVTIAWGAGLLAGPDALAVPASPRPVELKQPDGTVITARFGGDERFGWISVDGQLVEKGPDGFWRYMRRDNGCATRSDARVGLDAAPAEAATTADIPAMAKAALAAAPAPSRAPVKGPAAAPVTLQPTEPLLVILVEFSDISMRYTETQWANAFFSTTGKTVRTYYDEASRGSFYFTPAPETGGIANNGVVKVTLPYVHPNTGRGSSEQVVKDALIAADAYVNFASFKTDADSGLSTHELHIVTVWAGYEMAADPTLIPHVWAHRGMLGFAVTAPVLDGMTVGDWAFEGGYVAEGEIDVNQMATIGAPCHELGHDIGLPDLYDYTGMSGGVGVHCLMAGGSWGAAAGEAGGTTPVLMSAWCRLQMGFMTPTVLSAGGTYTLVQASNPVNSNVLKIPTSNPNEYFLLENRQLTGFDMGMYETFSRASGGVAGGGVAIWHVDESQASSGNNDYTHKHVDLEEANEGLLGYSELDTGVTGGNRQEYYYAGNVTAFDETTTPNSNLYNGTQSNVAIAGVSASGASMTLWFGHVAISGYVKTPDGIGLSGVTMTGVPSSAITNGQGYYTTNVPPQWSGTITPSKAGYTFIPTSRAYSQMVTDQSSQDYSAVRLTYKIGGTITTADGDPVAGVVLKGLPGSPSTDADGKYGVTVDYGWSGLITPTHAAYTFTPQARSYNNVFAAQPNDNYTSTPQTYRISGRVILQGQGIAGVVVNGLPGTPTTDSNGYYQATVNYGWAGTAAPTKTGLVFSPTTRNYGGVTSPLTSENYDSSVQTVTISGRVTLDGVGLAGAAMKGLPGTPSTDSNGYYQATVNYGWSGTGSVSKDWCTFTPGTQSHNSVTAPLTGQDYQAVMPTFTISGRVTSGGAGVAGVVLKGLPVAVATDSTGAYVATVRGGWSGTVTPGKSGLNFAPNSRNYGSASGNLNDENYKEVLLTNAAATSPQTGSNGTGGLTCPAAGFIPLGLSLSVLPWLLRPRTRRE